MVKDFGVGDLVCRLGHGRKMLVVDLEEDGSFVICSWRGAHSNLVFEDAFKPSRLVLIRRALGGSVAPYPGGPR